jgi:hypothetical protein
VRLAFHEDRFGVQDHELRGRTGWPAHEARAIVHERLHHAAPARLQVALTPAWPVQREPTLGVRHAPRASTRLPGSQAAAKLAPHIAATDEQGPPAQGGGALGGHHSRAYIHARHLARVRYQQQLREYHLELRQWRHLLFERERLLIKLASVERRLARLAEQPARGVAGETYEIGGAWFRQIGKRRPVELKKAPV